MAGYSGTPLAQKLGIKAGCRLLLVNPPETLASSLALPQEVTIVKSLTGKQPIDVAVLFVTAQGQLRDRFDSIARRLSPAGGLWISWPKKASGIPSDLTEDRIRDVGLAAGLVDNKVCAIDEVWSGLRFVYRLKDRPPMVQAGSTRR